MSSRDTRSSAWSPSAAAAGWIILGVALVTWITTVRSPFAEDDWLFLESVRSVRPAASFLATEGVMDHHYRPLSDALVFYLYRHPVVYHVIGMVAVVAAALALVSIAGAIGLPPPAAVTAGVLFASRDLFFPAMVWGSGFSDLGSAAFALAAVALSLSWAKDGGAWRAGSGLVLALAAVLTKEIAVVVVPLIAMTLAFVRARASVRARVGYLVVLTVAVGAVSFRQWQLAAFDEGYGASLYELGLGWHTLERLPVYAAWSVAAIREIDSVLPALGLLLALTVAGWRLGFARGPNARSHRRSLLAALGWFVVAIAPALLAPNRFHTNYLGIAVAGPCWVLGAMLTSGARSPLTARILLAVLVVAGPVLVALKSAGRLESGGWVNLERAERLHQVVGSALPVIEGLPADARILLLGGLEVDMRVLGDPRNEGFGPQQVLASAVRVESGRYDLEVLSLPRSADLTASAADVAREIVASDPDRTRVVDLGPPVRDVTASFAPHR